MELKTGQCYSGFHLQEEQEITEINSKAFIFSHEKSGAKLFYLKNDDDNKVFSITFRTPPQDSTGVAHIVEHAVLCGSRKFPMKEPFVELIKGSLNTYLNAMTFPDKTMYPVASRNAKDFRNLMDVYLDAVFYPRIAETPEMLMQEGWHYELENPDSEITYKGVVYNEMKGVFSSPDAILETKVFAALFPDSPYGVESGGDPDDIPNLTQEQFVAFHQQYYHPSNSYIFLYGDVDIADTLSFIDSEYLTNFPAISIDSSISLQTAPPKPVQQTFSYPAAPDDSLQDKTFLSMNFVVGRADDAEVCLAMQILEYLLLETPAAPLKQALLQQGIGKDVAGSFVKSILQPTLGITVTGANAGDQERFVQTVRAELQRLVTEGIDKELIEACLNIFEFTLREADYGSRPKGLIYNIKCMDSWLYGSSPCLHLTFENHLNKVKQALTSRYFEELIERFLLNNPHQGVVVLIPEHGLQEAKEEEVRQQLAAYKATLSAQELEELTMATKRLLERQQAVDSPEALASIPLLQLKDIEAKAEELPLEETAEAGVPVLQHFLHTSDIAYVNLYFKADGIKQDQLPYIFLLAELLGKVSAGKYSYSELSNAVNTHTGGIGFDVTVYSAQDNDQEYQPKFIVKSKALTAKLPRLFELLGTILNGSNLQEQQRLQELVQEIKASWDVNLFRRGQQIATNRVLAYFSPAAQYSEKGMLDFYNFIADVEENFSAKAESLSSTLQTVAQELFTLGNMLVSVTLPRENYPAFQTACQEFIAELPKTKSIQQQYELDLPVRNEGLMTSGKVQYVVKGANFRQIGYNYTGQLKVLETILRYDYLWNKVRVQGGAYGGFAKFERNGNMVFGSYRDPNLRETITVYDETANYLRQFPSMVDEREMTKYIIGTISSLDTPLSAAQKGERAAIHYMRGVSQTMRQQERQEVLTTRPEDIAALAELVDAAMKQNYLCVLGNEQKIKEQQELFGQIRNVSK